MVASEKRLQKNNYNGLFFMTHQNAYPKCQMLVSYLKQVSIPEQEFLILYPFHDGGPSHIKTSPLICSANDWTGVYIIGTIAKFLRTFFYKTPPCDCFCQCIASKMTELETQIIILWESLVKHLKFSMSIFNQPKRGKAEKWSTCES